VLELRAVFACAALLADRRGQFFEPLRPSRRRPGRFLAEWLAACRHAPSKPHR
jgi:hypothetical protein